MTDRIALVVGAALLAIVGAEASADDALRDRLERRVYRNDRGESLPYRLFAPAGADAAKPWPMILFLHGAGERGDDNEAQLKHPEILRFITDEAQAEQPCLLVAPQCPKDDKWVPGYFGLKRFKDPPKEDTPGGPSTSMRLVTELLDALEKEFAVDPRRRYVTGLSMGGYGSYDLCVRRPDYFAAAVPICGGADPAVAKKIAHIPLWIFHGGEDRGVPTELSRNMVQALKQAGARPKYTEYPGVGHNSWTPAYKEPELADWLFGQHR